MKQKDMIIVASAAVMAAIFSFVASGLIFRSPSSRSSAVPTADTINTTFPDIKNDPKYNSIFNSNALDAAQRVEVGSGGNSQPFSTSQ